MCFNDSYHACVNDSYHACVLMIRIMHVLCDATNRAAKDNFPLTMFETDNKGILLIYLFSCV